MKNYLILLLVPLMFCGCSSNNPLEKKLIDNGFECNEFHFCKKVSTDNSYRKGDIYFSEELSHSFDLSRNEFTLFYSRLAMENVVVKDRISYSFVYNYKDNSYQVSGYYIDGTYGYDYFLNDLITDKGNVDCDNTSKKNVDICNHFYDIANTGKGVYLNYVGGLDKEDYIMED